MARYIGTKKINKSDEYIRLVLNNGGNDILGIADLHYNKREHEIHLNNLSIPNDYKNFGYDSVLLDYVIDVARQISYESGRPNIIRIMCNINDDLLRSRGATIDHLYRYIIEVDTHKESVKYPLASISRIRQYTNVIQSDSHRAILCMSNDAIISQIDYICLNKFDGTYYILAWLYQFEYYSRESVCNAVIRLIRHLEILARGMDRNVKEIIFGYGATKKICYDVKLKEILYSLGYKYKYRTGFVKEL